MGSWFGTLQIEFVWLLLLFHESTECHTRGCEGDWWHVCEKIKALSEATESNQLQGLHLPCSLQKYFVHKRSESAKIEETWERLSESKSFVKHTWFIQQTSHFRNCRQLAVWCTLLILQSHKCHYVIRSRRTGKARHCLFDVCISVSNW